MAPPCVQNGRAHRPSRPAPPRVGPCSPSSAPPAVRGCAAWGRVRRDGCADGARRLGLSCAPCERPACARGKLPPGERFVEVLLLVCHSFPFLKELLRKGRENCNPVAYRPYICATREACCGHCELSTLQHFGWQQ